MIPFLVLAVMACGGSTKPTKAPIGNTNGSGSAVIAESPPRPQTFEEVVEMCACPAGDVGCAKKVTDAMIAWSEQAAKRADEPNPNIVNQMQPLMEEFTKCSMHAMTPANPPPPATP